MLEGCLRKVVVGVFLPFVVMMLFVQGKIYAADEANQMRRVVDELSRLGLQEMVAVVSAVQARTLVCRFDSWARSAELRLYARELLENFEYFQVLCSESDRRSLGDLRVALNAQQQGSEVSSEATALAAVSQ